MRCGRGAVAVAEVVGVTESVQRGLHHDLADERDDRDLRALFKAHCSPAFAALVRHHMDLERADKAGEPSPSLANGEKVPTSGAPDRPQSGDSPERGGESVFKDPPQTVEEVGYISQATEAIQASISCGRDVQRKVLALIGEGEIAHAKRLAQCRQKSVQLECPEMAGGCGSNENYVPIHCDSRLCGPCMSRRQGQLVEKYAGVVGSWGHPTMFRLGSPKRVEPERLEEAVDALRGAFGRLRRRVIPPDGDEWTWPEWKRALCAVGRTDLARRWQRKYVDEGRGIPFSEVVPGGFYGIDVKQGADGTLNVHAHVLANVPWLPQAALSSLWGDIHAAPVVDIRRVDARGESDLERATMEVVGYAAKAPEFQDAEAEAEYLTTLKGSKLIQPFGDLHGNTPEVGGWLHCCECEIAPAWWNYLAVVDGTYSTAIVGSSAGGDRPPPGCSDRGDGQ